MELGDDLVSVTTVSKEFYEAVHWRSEMRSEIEMLLTPALSDAIKTQLRAPKASYFGPVWLELRSVRQ